MTSLAQRNNNGLIARQALQLAARDPSLDGIQGLSGDDPLHNNAYLYADADPVNDTDPSGLSALSQVEDVVDDLQGLSLLDEQLNVDMDNGASNFSIQADLLAATGQLSVSPFDGMSFPGLQFYMPLIERHEGRRYTVYMDTRGNPTIGVGFNLNQPGAGATIARLLNGVSRNDLLSGAALTDAQVDTLFQFSVIGAVLNAESQLPNFGNLDTKAQEVVVDMMFNLGPAKFAKFKNFKADLGRLDYAGASQEMINSAWYSEVPTRAKDDVQLMNEAAGGQ